MPDVNAAIGLAQLEKAEYFRTRRQQCAEFYFEEFSGISAIDLPVCRVPMDHHSWHLFPVTVKPEGGVSRGDFIQLMAEKGIGTTVHYKPLHHMTYYKETYNLDPADFPNSEKIWNGTVSLPIYPDLKDEELRYVCDSVKSIFSIHSLAHFSLSNERKVI